eukprot:Hpha_TRINITY_DN15849_c1_g1::TRINITY_DN15849_c1_g1_i2::g.191638::m.191638
MKRLGLVLAALATTASAREVPLHGTNGEKHPTRYVATMRDEPAAERLVSKYSNNKAKRIKTNKNKPGWLTLDFDTPDDLAKFRQEEGDAVEFLEHDVKGHIVVNMGTMSCSNQQSGAPWGLRRLTSATLSNDYEHDNNWAQGFHVTEWDKWAWCRFLWRRGTATQTRAAPRPRASRPA